MVANEGFAKCVDGAGADIAEHHAYCAHDKLRQRPASVMGLRLFLRVVGHDRIIHF
jgi:hypothetical protein